MLSSPVKCSNWTTAAAATRTSPWPGTTASAALDRPPRTSFSPRLQCCTTTTFLPASRRSSCSGSASHQSQGSGSGLWVRFSARVVGQGSDSGVLCFGRCVRSMMCLALSSSRCLMLNVSEAQCSPPAPRCLSTDSVSCPLGRPSFSASSKTISGLLEFDSKTEALEVLTVLNHYQIRIPSRLMDTLPPLWGRQLFSK